MASRALAARWANVSLRAKITGVTVFILTLGLLVAGVGTLSFLRPQLIAQQDAVLRQLQIDPTPALATGANSGSLKRADVIGAADTFYLAVIDVNGNLLYDNFNGEASAAGPLVPIITAARGASLKDSVIVLSDNNSGAAWRAVLSPIVASSSTDETSGYLLIASSTEQIDGIMARYITIFASFGIIVVILGALLTRVLVTTTLEPLRQVGLTAGQIARGDFSRRLTVEAPATEVGQLGTALNTMLDHIDDSVAERDHTIERMRRFVGDASHELRTPLVSVRGYAELYRMGGISKKADVAQAMERIEKEAVRMASLVEDLLALARLDDYREVELVEIDLRPLARDAALDATAQAPDRVITVVDATESIRTAGTFADALTDSTPAVSGRVTSKGDTGRGATPAVKKSAGSIPLASGTVSRLRALGTRLSLGDTGPIDLADVAERNLASTDDVEPVVLGNEDRLRQVLNNLLVNAIRYSPEGTPIEIVITPRPYKQSVRLEVVDHGEGIPEQLRTQIFQRFWRADSSRNRETGGSGLGLSIVSSIVSAHGGTITVRDTPGGGATFRVDLPSAKVAKAAIADIVRRPTPPASR